MAITRHAKQREAEQATTRDNNVDFFSILTDDLLLEILTKLPANVLRFKVRFVCRRWYNLITNRILFDHASLILEKPMGNRTRRLIDIREENNRLKTNQQNLYIPYNGWIRSWCNEFLLITDIGKEGSLYIFNLITKEGSFLPECSTTSCGGHDGCKCGVGLSYDKFMGIYKVVHVFMGTPMQCELLVLKGNVVPCDSSKWKKIKGPSYMGQKRYYWEDPVSVQGRYFHWDVHCSKYLVSMDTAIERFRQTRLPGSDDYPMNDKYSLIEMGGFLTLLHKASDGKVHIWMLKDFRRTKWEMFQSISVSSYVGSSMYLGSIFPLPVTSVKSKRYLIFRLPASQTGLYSYDLKESRMKKLGIKIAGDEHCVVHSTAASFI